MSVFTRVKERMRPYKIFVPFLILNLCFYGSFVIKHYAADTYLTETMGWEVIAENYFVNGRWLMVILFYLCKYMHISHALQQFVSWGIAIVSVSAAAAVVYRLLVYAAGNPKDTKKRLWLAVIAFMMISNLFLLEYFIFPEYTGMMCLGIFFDAVSAKYTLKFLENKKVSCYLKALGFAILGINGHQGNFAIVVVICMVCAADTFDQVKLFLKNNLVIGSVYAIPALINMLQTRIGDFARTTRSGGDILETFYRASEGLYRLLGTSANFLPWGVYAAFIGILGLCFLFYVVKMKRLKALVFGGYYFLLVVLGIYAPLMMTDAAFLDVVPRTVYIMGGIVPIILACMAIHLDIYFHGHILLTVCVAAFLGCQYFGIQRISTGHYQTNELDRYEAEYIGARLYEYEEETGIQVTKMAVYWDDNVTGLATGVVGYGAVNERVMSNDWAAPFVIQCLDGHMVNPVDKSDEVYETYFKGKNWNHISEEQIVILGDTLHYCAY